MLKAKGYTCGAAVSAYVLRRATGLARDFDVWDDAMEVHEAASLGELQRPGDQAAAAAVQFLDAAGNKPPFVLLHLFEPHSPYEPPEPFKSRYASRPYDGEIATADAIVGRFVDGLRQRKLYDRALIVLFSDHGEGLGQHGEREHGVLLYRETLHVPLIVKLPGGARAGNTVDAPAGLVDVVPTVLAAVGVTPPPGLAGRSLLDDAAEPRRIYSETMYPRIHLGWSGLRSLVDERFQLIDGPDPELYDVIADPGETRNLRDSERRELSMRRAELEAIPLRLERAAPASPEELARLQALGYLGGSSAQPSGPPLDPKAHLSVLDDVQRVFVLNGERRYREASDLCRQILRDYPDLVDVYVQLAGNLRHLGRFEEALLAFQEAARRSPALRETLALEIGKLELDRGHLDLAAENAQLALAANPLEAHLLLGGIASARGDLEAAEREARSAVGDPAHPRVPALLLLAGVLIDRGRLEEGLSSVDQAASRISVGASPPVATLESTRGDALARLGRAQEAEEAFRREIASFPATTQAYTRLAVLLAAQRRFAEIEPLLDLMIDAVPAPSTCLLAEKTVADLGNRQAAARYRARAEALRDAQAK
jgi:tetratricopeptide (TPR) repeat protein